MSQMAADQEEIQFNFPSARICVICGFLVFENS